MLDFFMSLLSEELLSKAEYINGVLYLPATALLEELLSLVCPLIFLSMFLGIVYILVDVVIYLVRYAYRRFRNKIARGIFHGH